MGFGATNTRGFTVSVYFFLCIGTKCLFLLEELGAHGLGCIHLLSSNVIAESTA